MTTHTIPGLDIEIQGTDTEGRAVLLRQEFGGNVHQVELQELHVRWLAQQLSISKASDLQRALQRSLEMAINLRRLLQITNDFGHEDLDTELAHAVELTDFLKFICDGFRGDGDQQLSTQSAPAPAARAHTPPATLATVPLFAQPEA